MKCPHCGTEISSSKAKCTWEELAAYCAQLDLPENDATYLYEHWEGNGWMNGKQPIKNWQATVRAWKAAGYLPSQKQAPEVLYIDGWEPDGWRHYLCTKYPGIDFYKEWHWLPLKKRMECQQALIGQRRTT